MVAGDYFGAKTDNNVNLAQSSVFDLFEAQGVSYKGYMEGYSGTRACTPAHNLFHGLGYPFLRGCAAHDRQQVSQQEHPRTYPHTCAHATRA